MQLNSFVVAASKFFRKRTIQLKYRSISGNNIQSWNCCQ